MQVWHGYVGRYVQENGKERWESGDPTVANLNLPAVGQWYFGTDGQGRAQKLLYAKVYDSSEEAAREHERVRGLGWPVMVWSPQERDWKITKGQGEARAQGCGGCAKSHRCAGRRGG